MKCSTQIVAMALLVASAGAHAQDSVQEPSAKMTALALYKQCADETKVCIEYLDQARHWVEAHPEVYGAICDGDAIWTDSHGKQYRGTAPSGLPSLYWRVRNQSWLKTASAHDAAIWTIQGSFPCYVQQIAAPGEPGFPTKMIDKSPKFHQ